MTARHVTSPFLTARPVRLPASVLRVNKPAPRCVVCVWPAVLRGRCCRIALGSRGRGSRSSSAGWCRPRSTRWKAWLSRWGRRSHDCCRCRQNAGTSARCQLARASVWTRRPVRVAAASYWDISCRAFWSSSRAWWSSSPLWCGGHLAIRDLLRVRVRVRYLRLWQPGGTVKPGDALAFDAKVPHGMRTRRHGGLISVRAVYAARLKRRPEHGRGPETDLAHRSALLRLED